MDNNNMMLRAAFIVFFSSVAAAAEVPGTERAEFRAPAASFDSTTPLVT